MESDLGTIRGGVSRAPPREGILAADPPQSPVLRFKRLCFELGGTVHDCNSTLEGSSETRRFRVQGQLAQLSKTLYFYLKIKYKKEKV